MKIRDKLKNMPLGVKVSMAFFLANVVTKGIGYITTPLYTRLLSPDEYGQVSVFLTWVTIFGIVAMFRLSAGVFNNGMLDYPEKRDEYSFSMLILSNIITLCFSAVFLCLYPLVRVWVGLDWPLVILMCVIFIFQPAYNFWSAKQRYEMKYKAVTIWSVVSAFLSPLVAVICIFLFKDNRLYARIFGAEIALIAIYMGFYIYIWIKNSGKLVTKYWKAAILFNLPLIPHYLSTYLLGSSDKIMISGLIGDTAAAYYSIAYSVSAIATLVWSSATAALLPYTYEKCKKNDYNAVSAVTMPILTVFAGVCIFAIMLAPEVVAIMATADYREAIYAIPPIMGGVFFQMQYYIYANIVYYHKKPKLVMYASVISAVLNILLNYIFIRKYGYIAAGYTTLVCYLIQAVIDYLAMKKVVGRRVYNMRYLGVMSLIVVVVSLLSNMLYGHVAIRYVIVAAIILCCVLFRKRIMETFAAIKRGKNEA